MQQYRVAAPVHGGGDIAAVRNSAGAVEIFTIGTGGSVWNFYPDPASDSGYSSVDTGLVARAIAAGVDAQGRVVVFAANNIVLNYVTQTGAATGPRWGAVQQAALPLPPSPLVIAKIYTQQIGGSLYVGVLTRMGGASPGATYAFAYGLWNQAPGTFTATNLRLSTLNCGWSGSSAATAQFTCLDEVCLGLRIATGAIESYPVPAVFHSLAAATAQGGDGANLYFAVLDDGNVYRLTGSGQAYSWAPLTTGLSLRGLRAHRDNSGGIHLFALGANARVYHLSPNPDGGWLDPAPIRSHVALMAAASNDGGDIELYLVGTAQGALTRMIRESDTTDWEVAAIEVQTSGQVEEFIAYSTDVSVYDAAGALLPKAPVQVSASAQTELIVNGAFHMVDPLTPVHLTANAAGRLCIVQQTHSLCVPGLEFSIVGLTPAGNTIGVRQYAGTQDRLGAVTGAALLAAEDASGAFLLSGEFRNQATADAMAQTFDHCMQLADSPTVALDPASLPPRARRLGVGRCRRGSAASLNRLKPSPGMKPWQIDFSGGRPVFQELTPEAAHRLLIEKRARYPSPDGFFDIFEDIGDFVVGIAEGIVDVVDAVVHFVEDVAHGAITFIVDGVTYLFETVVRFAEQAFDLVATVWAKVKVSFGQLFDWLGFLFNWKDILRTHEALSYTVNQYLGFVGGAAGGMRRVIDNGIAAVQGDIDAFFDRLIAGLGGGSVGGYLKEKDRDEPAFSASLANNIVLNGAMDNASASTSMTALSAAGAGGPLDPVIASLEQLARTIGDLPEFAQARSYMEHLGSSPDSIFQSLLSALLRIVQGIVKAVIAGVQAAIDGLLGIAAALMGHIQGLLNAQWDIPFVTAFYAWLTDGAELTLLDLLCLIVAIPSTILFKALEDAAPFPDAAAVSAFKASFSTATMLANSGLGPRAATLPSSAARDTPPPSSQVAAVPPGTVLLGIAGLLSTAIFGLMSAGMDVEPIGGTGEIDPTVKKVSKWALAIEIIGQAAGTPWITSSQAPDCTSEDGAAGVVWIYECVGVLLDAAFIWKYEAFAENINSDLGVMVSLEYGLGHCLTVIRLAEFMNATVLGSKIAVLVPELAKPLRLSAVSGENSLVVLALLDGVGFVVSAILSFYDLTKPHDERLAVPGAVPSPMSISY